jgi:hypothetical protein
MNVAFEYRYRDLGNFKNYNSVVFANELGLPSEKIDNTLLELTGPERLFFAADHGLPEMFFKDFRYDPELDWGMHEYLGASSTDAPSDDREGRDISDLLSGWTVAANTGEKQRYLFGR